MLAGMGCFIIDADEEARLAVEKGEKAYNDIITHFGPGIIGEDGQINRPALGAIIFKEENQRMKLNEIVHPAVRERMLLKREQASGKGLTVVLDIPLLFESRLGHMADKTLLVYVDEQTQLNRLMNRNSFSEEEALLRIRSQMPLREKLELADEVIDNNGSLQETEFQLREILKKWGMNL